MSAARTYNTHTHTHTHTHTYTYTRNSYAPLIRAARELLSLFAEVSAFFERLYVCVCVYTHRRDLSFPIGDRDIASATARRKSRG